MKVFFVPLLIFVFACSDRTTTTNSKSQPLSIIREWNLVETDSLYLGRAGIMELSPEGTAFVSDYSTSGVYEFDRDGKFLRQYGYGRGSGPGEFIGPTGLAITNDRVAVEDIAQFRTSEFSRSDGELLRSAKHGRRITFVTYHGHILRGSVMTGGDEHETFTEPFSTNSPHGVYPQVLQTVRAQVALSSVGMSSGNTDFFVMAYEGIDTLYVYSSATEPPRPIVFPRLNRVGVDPDVLAYIQTGASRPNWEHVRNSVPYRLRTLKDSSTVVLMLDPATQKIPPALLVSRIGFSGQVFYLDLPIPLDSQTSRPLVALSDTSVVILEQLVLEGDKPITRLREFRLPP